MSFLHIVLVGAESPSGGLPVVVLLNSVCN